MNKYFLFYLLILIFSFIPVLSIATSLLTQPSDVSNALGFMICVFYVLSICLGGVYVKNRM